MKNKIKIAETKKIKLSDIKPYWRNPRDNNQIAVERVKESIRRFGYNQYIALDKNNVIIVGHTRYKALLGLGDDEIDKDNIKVHILDLTKQKAKEYRILDNKTNEYSDWTDNLKVELKEIDDLDFMQDYFDFDLKEEFEKEVDFIPESEEDIEEKEEKETNKYRALAERHGKDRLQITCPYCHEEFEVD